MANPCGMRPLLTLFRSGLPIAACLSGLAAAPAQAISGFSAWTEEVTTYEIVEDAADNDDLADVDAGDPAGDNAALAADHTDDHKIGARASSPLAGRAIPFALASTVLVQATYTTDTGSFGPSRLPLAQSGPFYLTARDTIEMIGVVDSESPRQFAAFLAAHPGVARLVMVDCPGSVDEDANHRLAREVRRAGLATVVPRGGSVRSGAVELFLAGVRRSAARDAEFAVHSWRDEDGHEAADFAADDPVNVEYIDFYKEMGLSDAAARAFYALTNSVPFGAVRALSAADMAKLGLAEITG